MSGYDEPLESGLVEDIPKSRALYEQLRQFHWEYYSELAYQRNKIYDSLKSSLRERAKPFDLSRWQRVVKYKHALDPLGTTGSIVDPGGRFNIGAIDSTRYPVFAALYVASDKGTSLAELLGRIVLDAQVEGILYKSVLTGKPCLALYHRNFGNSLSYVELDDPAPAEVIERRLDSSNCKDTI